ncbi:hypothetical protein HY837_00445 [archaeon]|nr:hypothetical protein [archaeon]
MNNRIAFLTCSSNCEGLKSVLDRYATSAGLSSFIEDLVKEVKAKSLAFEGHDSLSEGVSDLRKLKKFINQRAIEEKYGYLPRLHSHIDETEGYLEQLLTKHPSQNDAITSVTSANIHLMADFLNSLTTANEWVGERYQDLVLALCLKNFKNTEEAVNVFNEKYASKLGVKKVSKSEVPFFGSSKLKDLENCVFAVENTDVKLEFPHVPIKNSVGAKAGEYFVFIDFEKIMSGGKEVLKPSFIGFEANYITARPLEKTKISYFQEGNFLLDAKKSFKDVVEAVDKLCAQRPPRHEVSKLLSNHSFYSNTFHPTKDFFVGNDKNYSFKVSVDAQGPVNHHTVKVRGEFYYNSNNR